MSYPQQLSRIWIEKLMEISTALGDYTHSASQCAKIPNYLGRILGLEPMTLTIIDTSTASAPRIALMSSSLEPDAGEDSAFAGKILSLYQSTLATQAEEISATETSDVHASGDVERAALPMNVSGFPVARIFAREMDDSHRMLLIAHHQEASTAIADDVFATLQLIACQLSKLLRCMVACSGNSHILGGGFNQLTEREWEVLRVLNSDDGEKQIAERLSLSPHTLHSHIKSIYRKVGVQGRLSLLLRLREAQQDLRLATLNTPVDAARVKMSA